MCSIQKHTISKWSVKLIFCTMLDEIQENIGRKVTTTNITTVHTHTHTHTFHMANTSFNMYTNIHSPIMKHRTPYTHTHTHTHTHSIFYNYGTIPTNARDNPLLCRDKKKNKEKNTCYLIQNNFINKLIFKKCFPYNLAIYKKIYI